MRSNSANQISKLKTILVLMLTSSAAESKIQDCNVTEVICLYFLQRMQLVFGRVIKDMTRQKPSVSI